MSLQRERRWRYINHVPKYALNISCVNPFFHDIWFITECIRRQKEVFRYMEQGGKNQRGGKGLNKQHIEYWNNSGTKCVYHPGYNELTEADTTNAVTGRGEFTLVSKDTHSHKGCIFKNEGSGRAGQWHTGVETWKSTKTNETSAVKESVMEKEEPLT